MGKITRNLSNQLKKTTNIKTFILENSSIMNNINFSNYLQMLLKKNNLKIPDIIFISNIDKSYVYDIFKGRKKPRKNKILAIAFAMNLTLDEINQLLNLAGFSPLYSRYPRESAIIYANMQKMNTTECNDLLFSLNFEILA